MSITPKRCSPPPTSSPATRSGTSPSATWNGRMSPGFTSSQRMAAGLKNSTSERSVSRRSAEVAIRLGWTKPARNTSRPRILSASPRRASFASTSTTGLATATSGIRARSGYSTSSKPARGPRTSRSASPDRIRTPCASSLIAAWLMICTA